MSYSPEENESLEMFELDDDDLEKVVGGTKIVSPDTGKKIGPRGIGILLPEV